MSSADRSQQRKNSDARNKMLNPNPFHNAAPARTSQKENLTQSPSFPLPHFPISLADIHSKADMSTSSLSLLLPSSAFRPSWQTNYRPSPTAAELEYKSQFLVEAINAQNFSSQVTDLIAPGFRAAIGDFNQTQDFQQHKSTHQHVRQSAASYRVRVVNASSDIDERSGTATVFQLLDVQGYAESMRTQAICVMKWTKPADRWLLEALYGMSGLGASDG